MPTLNKLAASAIALLIGSSSVVAKVSVEEANKLKGTELTPIGAERKGNADGSIPAYVGNILGAPNWVDYKGTGTHYPDTYPNEKPLFTVTASNMSNYAPYLTEGMIELFKRFPNTFKMPVYQSHRDSRYSDFIRDNAFSNATRAELTSDSNGIVNAYGGPPFPIPQNGLEVVFNHATAQIPYNVEALFDEFAVYPTGELAKETVRSIRYLPFYDPFLGVDAYHKGGDIAALVVTKWLSPVRRKGEIVLVNENLNYTETPRQAWIYMPGARRVRRAPTIGYDAPNGAGGLRTVDDQQMFNGAVDRFDWVLEGKKEILIPYHNYKLEDPTLKYDQIIQTNHLNPEFLRYELHRVWVVAGHLKSNKRHIYGLRRLYIDEDSWHAAYAENYDGKGQLWRVNMKTLVNAYDMPGITGRLEIYRDLQQNAYAVNNLINEQKRAPIKPAKPYSRKFFTPAAIRKSGH